MADKIYKLNFTMSDGTTKSVQFTAPQGEPGEPGSPGNPGDDGIGITDITIEEV